MQNKVFVNGVYVLTAHCTIFNTHVEISATQSNVSDLHNSGMQDWVGNKLVLEDIVTGKIVFEETVKHISFTSQHTSFSVGKLIATFEI